VAHAKQLGVTAVRLWLGISDYDARPSPTDPEPSWQSAVQTRGLSYSNSNGKMLRRIFDFHREGFDVLLTVQHNHGQAPTSSSQASSFFNYLKNIKDPSSTATLADAVDYWEIGNEPDLGEYWKESATDKVTGLRSYVDKLLIPAAEALRSGPSPEQVVTGGVSWKPEDMNNILSTLQSRGKLGVVDYAGYHPYGRFNPDTGFNEQKDRALAAAAVGAKFNIPVMATEWNVRGYAVNGTQNTQWARAVDENFRNVMAPLFHSVFYFATTDNWDLRGGSISGRPASVLMHDSAATNVQNLPLAEIEAWLKTPLVKNEPFYAKFHEWQFGTVSGKVSNDTAYGSLGGRSVFVDLNNNGTRETAEPLTVTAADGTYTLKYSSRQVRSGTYALRVFADGWEMAQAAPTLVLGALKNASDIDFTLKRSAPPVTTGIASGRLWHDADADNLIDSGEVATGGRVVYLDFNDNRARDASEPSTTAASDGTFTVQYDTAVTPPGTYALRQVLPSGWETTGAGFVNVAVSAGGSASGLRLGSRPTPVTPIDNAVIGGFLWNDGNTDGVQNSNETRSGARVVFIDADGDRKLDTGEKQTSSDAQGNYQFTGLAAGTYEVTRVFPTGYRLSNDPSGALRITVAAGQQMLTANIGTTDAPITTPGGSIGGYLFNDSNANGVQDGAETRTGIRTVFIDANRNNRIDTGEKQTQSNAAGEYRFTNLTAGTYYVSRVMPTGYRLSTSTQTYLTVTLSAGQMLDNVLLGSTTI
ncbi:MAG TPA: SdrD B-like domain-containing protein, partial [Tepidisphaeraceae bacterium]